jgi:hypothetical protein
VVGRWEETVETVREVVWRRGHRAEAAVLMRESSRLNNGWQIRDDGEIREAEAVGDGRLAVKVI